MTYSNTLKKKLLKLLIEYDAFMHISNEIIAKSYVDDFLNAAVSLFEKELKKSKIQPK